MSLKIEPISIVTNCDLLQELSKDQTLINLVAKYLGWASCLDFVSALREMNAQRTESIERRAKLLPSDLLKGEAGLTGVCLGYSLSCVSWVERHAALPQMPPLMVGRPSEEMRNLSKLLLLSVFQNTPKATSPKLERISENKPLITKMIDHYAELQRRRTGIVMEVSLPGPTTFEHEPVATLLERFALQPHTEKDHYLFLHSGTHAICDWHAIYINPALGVIGDASIGLLWKIEKRAQTYFHHILREFMESEGYTNSASLIKMSLGPRTSCTPLFASRVGRRLQTAWCMARHSGVRAGLGYLKEIHAQQPIVRYFFPKKQPMMEVLGQLRRLLSQNKFDELVPFVKKNLEIIRNCLPPTYASELLFEGLVTHQVMNPVFLSMFLKTLTQLHDLKADRFLAYLLNKTLNNFRENIFLEHLHKNFLKELLELRKKCTVRVLIFRLINRIELNPKTFPLFALLAEYEPKACTPRLTEYVKERVKQKPFS